MNEDIEAQLQSLLRHINAQLDLILDEANSRFDWLARSVGQKTRTDRL